MKKWTGPKNYIVAAHAKHGDTVNFHGKRIVIDLSQIAISYWMMTGPPCLYIKIPFWNNSKGQFDHLNCPAGTKLTKF